MSTCITQSPGTVTNTDNGEDDSWSNPSNATALDGVYATCGPQIAGNWTWDLKATNFGFSIPSTATINGITVSVTRHTNTANTTVDRTVELIKGGTVQTGSNKASATAWGTSDSTVTYGGSTDLWSNTWLYSDVNASTFGVLVNARNGGGITGTANVDYISINVCYTDTAVTATIAATAALTASGTLTIPGSATIAATAALTASPSQSYSATIAATAALTASVSLVAEVDPIAAIANLTVSPGLVYVCPCNSTGSTSTGGVTLGGTPITVNNSTTGGVILGGSPVVSHPGYPASGIVSLWLLNEAGTGEPGEYLDLTVNANDGTGGDGGPDVTKVPTQDLGVFCLNSQNLNGNQYITMPPDGLSQTAPFTLSCWVKISEFYAQATLFSSGHDDDTIPANWRFNLGYSVLNQLYGHIQLVDDDDDDDDTTTTAFVMGTTRLQRGTWYYVAMTWQPGVGLSLFVNGRLDGNQTVTELVMVPVVNEGYVGRWNDAETPEANIQMVRLDAVARDADYLQTTYFNICSPNFFTVAPEVMV